jgi:hypothetical protein
MLKGLVDTTFCGIDFLSAKKQIIRKIERNLNPAVEALKFCCRRLSIHCNLHNLRAGHLAKFATNNKFIGFWSTC